jgi:hypothetical protein
MSEETQATVEEKKFWSLRKKAEPNLSGDPGVSLISRIEKLTTCIEALITINKSLLKKQEENFVLLQTLAKFVASQSEDVPRFEVTR